MGHICSIQESAFVVGDAGTIVKTTDAGMTWSPLTSGTTNALHDVYFFDATQGVAVGEQGLILRTTDGGAGWQGVTSGVKDALRSVSFSGVNGISGGDSQTILYSTDAGASWQISQSWILRRRLSRRADAECDRRLRWRDKIRSSSRCLALALTAAPVGMFHAFLF